MTKDFKKSIYELLEQSKMEKELNKVKKSKPSNPKMKPQSLIRAKRVGKNKYNYDIGSYEDFERMMDEDNKIEKHSIKQILKDVIENIKDDVRMDDEYYDYDRVGFIKMLNKMSEVTIRAAQKQVDPPLLVPDDGFMLPIRTVPGGLNFYRSGTRDRIEP